MGQHPARSIHSGTRARAAAARRLSAAGVPADAHVFAGAPHGFDIMMPGTAVAQRARPTLQAWLKPQLHPARVL